MRLIDADKLELKHYLQGGNAIVGYAGTIPLYHYVSVIKEDINNAPTVDAIPVQWLKKQVKEGWYDIIEIMDHWELENNIKKSILWSEENDQTR